MKKYDLIIIGGGAAAFAALNLSNKLKKKTLVINNSRILPIGGTCVNVGCVPSKIMLHQGRTYYYSVRSPFESVKLKGKCDFLEALKETRKMVNFYRKKNYKVVIRNQEYVDFEEGAGRFEGEHIVSVGGKRFYGDKILISTGASPFVPEIPGLNKGSYITSSEVFSLKKKPKSVVILGGGAVAMEFSQIFNYFGVKVTVLQRSKQVLSKYDSFVGEELRKHLEREKIKICTEANVKSVKKAGRGYFVEAVVRGNIKRFFCEKILIGLGLRGRTRDINAEAAGVRINKRGFVNVNKYLQSSKQHIYAAGDVTGIMPLETVAARQGAVAANNMFNKSKKTIDYSVIPSAVFTYPEVAFVGIGEEEYIRRHKTCLCRTMDLSHVEKAGIIGSTGGKIRMVLNHKTRRIVGVGIVAPMAADIITTATYAIANKMTPEDVRNISFVFPTLSEMIKKAAQSFTEDLDNMACCVE